MEGSGAMRFFDAHCDTVMRVFDADLDFVQGRGRGHMDLPRLLAAGHRIQLFAVFASRNYHASLDVRAYAEQAIGVIRGWVDASAGRMRLALSAGDVAQAFAPADERESASESVWALIGLEGADPLEGRAENLARFHELGVRNVIPAWDDNAFSGSSFGQGGPLTAEGYKLIEAAEALRIMVDVSHLSDAAFDQVQQIARRPFIASHSNCRALCPSPRNLTDAQIRALADRGGVMGINLSPDFLAADYHVQWEAVMAPLRTAALGLEAEARAAARQKLREQVGPTLRAIPLPPVAWVARHVQHAIQVGGEECIGLGGDLDGVAALPAGVTGVEGYPLIVEALDAAGLTAAQVEKVCWRNMARVFVEVMA